MIIITGSVQLDGSTREEAIALGCEHSARSREEDGCISHECYLSAEDTNRMHFFERWKDSAAVKQHFVVPQSGEFIRKISQLAISPPEISIYEAHASSDPRHR